MNIKVLIFSILLLSLIAILSFASNSDIVTINLNATKVWWNESVFASGVAKYSNGNPIQGSVELTVDGSSYDCPNTDENGNWNCTFHSPARIGSFLVTVNVTNATGHSVLNNTPLTVSPYYGKIPIGTIDKVVYELPILIQDLSGEIKTVFARIMVWKG